MLVISYLLATLYSFGCGVTAGFTPSGTIVCAGDIVNFTNTSTGAISYEWHLEEFTFSTSTDAILSFGAPGDFNIELIADNGAGCLDSITIVITVEAPPNAGSDYLGSFCNINDSVELNSLVDGDVGGTWNETTNSGQFSVITSFFEYTGLLEDTYLFEYVVSTGGACPNDTAIFELDINQQPSLTLNLTENTIGLSDSLYVDFDTSGTNVVTSMIWQFCDGNFLGDESPFYYQWPSEGSYCVCVTINNNNGCSENVCDSSIVVVDDLSAYMEEQNFYSIYPNPTINELIVKIKEPELLSSIDLISLDGRTHPISIQAENEVQSIDVSSFTNGIYLLRLSLGENVITKQIIVNH